MGKDQELLEAARNGDYHAAEKILLQRAKRSGPLASLRRGPGANVQDSNGFSALHHAALNKHRDVVNLLLTFEASTNLVDQQGSSPLHLAAWSGNEEIVKLLLSNEISCPKVNLRNQSCETALHMASQFGHLEVVRLLLDHGADPTIMNSKEETSLDLAAQYGRLETVQLLLKSHPELLDPYLRCYAARSKTYRHTPLHLASRNGHSGVVEVLVRAGVEVNARTIEGTALHEAALRGKVCVVETLLDAGVDVCVADSRNRTALDRMSEVGLKTPVAAEITEKIRGAYKRVNKASCKSSPLYSPHDSSPDIYVGKMQLNSRSDNQSLSDAESSMSRRSYSPSQSPSASSFGRGKGPRRSIDAFTSKGPENDKQPSSTAPKKPPRRNLSASPTHPGATDFMNESIEYVMMSQVVHNKSADETSNCERRKQRPMAIYGAFQSTDSIEYSPSDPRVMGTSEESNSSIFNGLRRDSDDMKSKSKSQHGGLNDQYVSVAHIKLRDSKSEQNVSPSGLRISQAKSSDDIDSSDDPSPPIIPGAFSYENHDGFKNHGALQRPRKNECVLSKKPVPKGPKPAIAPKPVVPPKPAIAPKPKHIKQLPMGDKKLLVNKKSTSKSSSLSELSPVELEKEWDSITKFMDRLSVEMDGQSSFMQPKCETPVRKWLNSIGMLEYDELLKSNGFDDEKFLGEDILDENSLLEIGILSAQHRKIIARSANELVVSWPHSLNENGVPITVEKWLEELHLKKYIDTFRKNLYTDPERLLHLWNDELTTVLEIEPLGHRRRLLTASAKASGVIKVIDSTHHENGIEIDKAQSDTSLPLREPNNLVSGVSSAWKTAWRHAPETLIDGSVAYKAIYVGSCTIRDFSSTSAIQKAIQQIRDGATLATSKLISTQPAHKEIASRFNVSVTLIVSATVISWYDVKTKSLMKENEIGSIQCTCQASDDLRHLALVTQNQTSNDRISHFCHVFKLDSVDVATEAILTLGQAFEVAYQLALTNSKQTKDFRGHMRSKSANQLSTKTVTQGSAKLNDDKKGLTKNPYLSNNHSRSHSVTDIPTPSINHIPKPSCSSKDEGKKAQSDARSSSCLSRAEAFGNRGYVSPKAPIVSKDEL